MREIRLSGLEGGGAYALPTPIAMFKVGAGYDRRDLLLAVFHNPPG